MSYPIVGAHFRPPAKALLASLPNGHPLWLVPEPENPYDSRAIAVFLQSVSIPKESEETLEAMALGMGHDLESIKESEWWHLGYIPKTHNVELAKILATQYPDLTTDFPCYLCFDMKGAPQVTLTEDSE